MNNDECMQYMLNFLDEHDISKNRKSYINGVLENDMRMKEHLKLLSFVRAVIIRSIQVKNFRRAIRFFIVYPESREIVTKNNAKAAYNT
jgi:intergrase/recombinase